MIPGIFSQLNNTLTKLVFSSSRYFNLVGSLKANIEKYPPRTSLVATLHLQFKSVGLFQVSIT